MLQKQRICMRKKLEWLPQHKLSFDGYIHYMKLRERKIGGGDLAKKQQYLAKLNARITNSCHQCCTTWICQSHKQPNNIRPALYNNSRKSDFRCTCINWRQLQIAFISCWDICSKNLIVMDQVRTHTYCWWEAWWIRHIWLLTRLRPLWAWSCGKFCLNRLYWRSQWWRWRRGRRTRRRQHRYSLGCLSEGRWNSFWILRFC